MPKTTHLAEINHIVGELALLQRNTSRLESRLADLAQEVEMCRYTTKHRGCTAEIYLYHGVYKCLVTSPAGDQMEWSLKATSMPEAIAEAESCFNYAVDYLRGYIIPKKFRKMEES